ALQDNFVQVSLRLRLPVTIDVLNLDCCVIHQNADGQRESTQRHDIDRLSESTENNNGRQNSQRDRGCNNQGAAPAAQERENHESGQTRGNQCLSDHSADRATNKNRLIAQQSYLQLGWNGCLNLRQKCLDACDYIQR